MLYTCEIFNCPEFFREVAVLCCSSYALPLYFKWVTIFFWKNATFLFHQLELYICQINNWPEFSSSTCFCPLSAAPSFRFKWTTDQNFGKKAKACFLQLELYICQIYNWTEFWKKKQKRFSFNSISNYVK